jgi:exosortase
MIRSAVETEEGVRSGSSLGEPGRKHFLFLFAGLTCVILFHGPIWKLAELGIRDDRYTADLFVPFLCVALVWLKRNTTFCRPQYDPLLGSAFFVVGCGAVLVSTKTSLVPADYVLSVRMLAFVLFVVGAFVSCYGNSAARAAIFPLSLMVIMIPIPASLLQHVVVALQTGSAAVSYRLFQLTGVPVMRESSVRFALPGTTIEVAEECSGIRSSLSLFITSLLAGHILLRSAWARSAFSLMTVPVVIIKNALRIVTISCLGVYVDSGFFYGRLHRYSGLPFSLVALCLLAPLLLWFMRVERVSSTVRQ